MLAAFKATIPLQREFGCSDPWPNEHREGLAVRQGLKPQDIRTMVGRVVGHCFRALSSIGNMIRAITMMTSHSPIMGWAPAPSLARYLADLEGQRLDEVLRKLSSVRRRVEQLATQAGAGRCNGYHRILRVVHVVNDAPTPPWPEEIGKLCACGAEIELFTIVHQHITDDRPEVSPAH